LLNNVIRHRAATDTELPRHPPLPPNQIQCDLFLMHHAMADISKEGHMQLAIEAYKKDLFSSKKAAADVFDVPQRTLKICLNGTTSHKDSIANCQKLTDTKEIILLK
ncbi:hypothetical protein T310_9471, partial [Rasamsonia emersonii CBS 393.64]